MSQRRVSRRSDILEAGVEEMKLETRDTHSERGRLPKDGINEPISRNGSSKWEIKRESNLKRSPSLESSYNQEQNSRSPEKHEAVIGGDVTVKMEPDQPPKLARSMSQKIVAGAPQLFNDYSSKTEEAQGHFQLISNCTYANKYLGYTEHGSMDCDCAEEWGMSTSFCYKTCLW